MKLCERTECSFHKWYPLFKQYTFKSVLEKLPPEVVSYLSQDGIVLPLEACSQPRMSNPDSSDFTVDWSTDGDEDSIVPPSFPEFSNKLQDAIDSFGGAAFIKMNWSAPTDSAWITSNKSMKCVSIEDMYLLLKSSDRFMENLESPLKGNPNDDSGTCHYVVLKKWHEIHPGTEFRCFVYNNLLIGISQRNCSDFHGHIAEEKFDIINDLTDFFKNRINGKFPLSNYTFDVIRPRTSKVLLVDFGVFQDKCSKSCLFTWQELIDIVASTEGENRPEFRYISSETGIQPSSALGSMFAVPRDLQYLSDNKMSFMDYIQDEVTLQEEAEQT